MWLWYCGYSFLLGKKEPLSFIGRTSKLMHRGHLFFHRPQKLKLIFSLLSGWEEKKIKRVFSDVKIISNSNFSILLTNGLRKYGIYTQWNSTQPWRRMKSYHSQVNAWNWRTSFWARSARLRRPKIVCSPSYVDFRSRENTAMWLNLSHMLRGEPTWEVWG
jgi:hypothetical protein